MNTIQKLAMKSSRKQVPALFKKIEWKENGRNLDLGGGKYDTATEWLEERGIQNFVIDPYNRTESHNRTMHIATCFAPLTSITLANVLNVIPEKENRLSVLSEAFRYYSNHRCPVYISCYNASGQPSVSDCQTCMPLEDYIPEIKEVFGNVQVSIQNNFIKIV